LFVFEHTTLIGLHFCSYQQKYPKERVMLKKTIKISPQTLLSFEQTTIRQAFSSEADFVKMPNSYLS